MPLARRRSHVNPQLGTFFGIFMSLFLAIALLAIIFEQLGVPAFEVKLGMLVLPCLLYLAIGIASRTQEPLDYFACGRRVPAFISGLIMAQTAMGATGTVAITGVFFLIGFDALFFVIGGLSGFVVMAVLLAPFFRKFGAYTVPTYLGRRFDSTTLRLAAGGILAVPMLLLLAAELRMGAYAVSWLLDTPQSVAVLLLGGIIILTVIAGGMRSLSWSSAGQALAALAVVIVPITIVAVIETNLPLPQLSAGTVLRSISRAEAAQGLPIILPPLLAFDMPSDGLAQIGKRFSDPFGSVGTLSFVIMMLTCLAGVGGAPWLLPRVAATPGVFEARKSLSWATLMFGLTMLTIASAGIFMRGALMDIVTVPGQIRLPAWLLNLQDIGVLSLVSDGTRPTIGSFSMARDAVLFGLPLTVGLPTAFVYIVAGGVIAAALASAGAMALGIGNALAEDVFYGLTWQPPPVGERLIIARGMVCAAVVLGCLMAAVVPTDPLRMLLWALALTGASVFPVLVLSIWWKRLNEFGALAGMATGFGVTVLAIVACEAGWTGIDGALVGAIGLPAGAIATVSVAFATAAPSKAVLELVHDIRIPGGEIVYDREMRVLRKQRNQRGS